MYKKPSLFKVTAIFFVILQPFNATTAFAAGFQLSETSPSLQGSALAGAAAADNDVTSLFNNPATLTTLKQNQEYIGANAIFPSVSMSNGQALHTVNVPGSPPSSITGQVIGKPYQDNIGKSVLVPDLYLSKRINDKLVAGLAIAAPFGLTSSYSYNTVLRFAAVKTQVKSLDINPVMAYQATERLSLGAGIQAQYLQATFVNFNGPYTGFAPIDAIISATHPTHLQGDGFGGGYTLGALYQLNKATRLGLGYRSSILTHLHGQGQQYTMPGGVVPAPSNAFLFNAQTSVSGPIRTPALLTLGAAHDINNWTVKATAQMNFWSSFKNLSISMPEAFAISSIIPMHWSNAWFGSIGADYRTSPSLTLRGGIAYDQTPTNSTYRDPRIPDADRVWTNLGMSYAVTKYLSIDGAYAHIFIKNQSINLSQAFGQSINSTLPLEINLVSAHYKGHVDIASLGLRYSC